MRVGDRTDSQFHLFLQIVSPRFLLQLEVDWIWKIWVSWTFVEFYILGFVWRSRKPKKSWTVSREVWSCLHRETGGCSVPIHITKSEIWWQLQPDAWRVGFFVDRMGSFYRVTVTWLLFSNRFLLVGRSIFCKIWLSYLESCQSNCFDTSRWQRFDLQHIQYHLVCL